MDHKAPDAFRTISEVADELDLPQHVLRFWESRFHDIRPMKRGGGRRYYRPNDIELLRGIQHLLYGEGYTIRGVQRILREQGAKFVEAVWREGAPRPPHGPGDIEHIEEGTDDAAPLAPERPGFLSRLIGRDLSDRQDDAPAREEPPMAEEAIAEAQIDEAPVPAVEVSVRVEPSFAPEPPGAEPPPPVVHLAEERPAEGLTVDEVGRLNAALYELAECRKLLARPMARDEAA